MAEKWQVEYHVQDNKTGEDYDVFGREVDAKNHADQLAADHGCAFKVEKVTQYYDDREEVYVAGLDEEEEDD